MFERKLNFNETCSSFYCNFLQALQIKKKDNFVIATTNREEIKDDESWGIENYYYNPNLSEYMLIDCILYPSYVQLQHFVWEKNVVLIFADDIDNGDTLYVLKKINQELCAPANERVNFVPHYDTIVKGGLYEYYASEGQNPLRENAKEKYD